jgi:alpha-tubulin suppressor-like RCC1 family protein
LSVGGWRFPGGRWGNEEVAAVEKGRSGEEGYPMKSIRTTWRVMVIGLLILGSSVAVGAMPSPPSAGAIAAPAGTLYAWGYGQDGELGNGTQAPIQTTPVTVSLPPGVTPTAIAAASRTGYAIGSDGKLYAWGYGFDGELGNGTKTMIQTTPVTVSLPVGVTPRAIASGENSGYAIGSNGKLYAWGYGAFGQLGNGKTTTQDKPVTVKFPTGVMAREIAAAWDTGYATGSNGKLYAWGSGVAGELGNAKTTTQDKPVTVKLPTGVTARAIAASSRNASAIGSNGKLYAWGSDRDGELGNGKTTKAAQSTPVAVSLSAGVTPRAIAEGEFDGYAVGSNGQLYAWGRGGAGQLGNDTKPRSQTTPVVVSFPAGVTLTAIAAAWRTGYAVGSDGRLYGWGNGRDGDLGNGKTTNQRRPVVVKLPTGVIPRAIAAGSDTAYAIVGS